MPAGRALLVATFRMRKEDCFASCIGRYLLGHHSMLCADWELLVKGVQKLQHLHPLQFLDLKLQQMALLEISAGNKDFT